MAPSRSTPGSRPSQVLPLPQARSAWSDPPVETGVVRTRDTQRRQLAIRVAVAAVVLLLGVSIVVTGVVGGTEPSGPPPRTDVATEDAVVAVLRVYQGEAVLADATAAGADVFGVPGPAGRAAAIEAAAGALQQTVVEVRAEDVAPGTPAATYLADADHDALLGYALEVAADARVLGFLGDLHQSLYGGAGVVPVPAARQRLLTQVLPADLPASARAWAEVLAQASADPAAAPAVAAAAEQARAAAGREWAEAAQRILPAAGGDLAAFLNGIDPGVLAALEGHPVAGPALARLR